jgi:beta-glucosidase
MAQWYSHESDDSMKPLDAPIATQLFDETRLFIGTSYPKSITRTWTVKLRGFLRPKPYDTDFEFGLIAAGRAKVRLFKLTPPVVPVTQIFANTLLPDLPTAASGR